VGKRKVKGKSQWRLLPKYAVDIHSKEYRRAQGPPTPRVALRGPLGGLSHKDSLL